MEQLPNRWEAGRRLAVALRDYGGRDDVVVLALPRGGVLVGAAVARQLGAPLDVFTVRKLGVPWNRELAVGAIAGGDVRVLDRRLMDQIGVSMDDMGEIIRLETAELQRREALYRRGRSPLDLAGRTVIVVDDGLATGATMAAAVDAIRTLTPRRIVVAVPVASRSACDDMNHRADECVCLGAPEPFYGVGHWYADFHDVSDREVLEALQDRGTLTVYAPHDEPER